MNRRTSFLSTYNLLQHPVNIEHVGLINMMGWSNKHTFKLPKRASVVTPQHRTTAELRPPHSPPPETSRHQDAAPSLLPKTFQHPAQPHRSRCCTLQRSTAAPHTAASRAIPRHGHWVHAPPQPHRAAIPRRVHAPPYPCFIARLKKLPSRTWVVIAIHLIFVESNNEKCSDDITE